MTRGRWPLVMLAVVWLGAALAAQDNGTVRVTVARANIRAEASETSKVLTQVTEGTILYLVAVEGDWFHVRVPMGPLRVDAYISKKVSKIETPPPPPAPPAAAPTGSAAGSAPVAPPAPSAAPTPAPSPAPSPTTRDGMSVTLTAAGNATMLVPTDAYVVEVTEKPDSLAKVAAAIVASPVSADAGGSPSRQVTYAWVTNGASAQTTLATRRPSFVALFKEVPGLSPDDLTAVLVRLTPTSSGGRVIAAVRGRADAASRGETDWDVLKDLKQDVVHVTVEPVDRGGLKVTPAADLQPGEYAVVVRPAARKKLAGSDVLGKSGEGRVFNVLWDFSIK